MDRLLSCYLDKMVNSDHVSLPPYRKYVQMMGRKIIRTRRAKQLATSNSLKSPLWNSPTLRRDQANPTFEEFLEFILNTSLQGIFFFFFLCGGGVYVLKIELETCFLFNECLVPVALSHEVMVNLIIITATGVGYESHWVPYSRYCTPCSVTYDVIGKLETASDDFQVRYITYTIHKHDVRIMKQSQI